MFEIELSKGWLCCCGCGQIFEVVESESGGQITFFALFRTKGDAEWYAAELQNVSASYWDPIGTVADGPKVYRWESQTTSNALQVCSTGTWLLGLLCHRAGTDVA